MNTYEADGRELGARDRKKLGTWFAIRDAGVRLFMERGFDAVSIEDIAAAAGVSRTTFFNYFAGKEALIRDCEPGERETWQHLLDRPEDEPLWDSLVALLVGFAEFRAEKLIAARWLMLRSPEVQALPFFRQHATCEDIESFVRRRTRPGNELEAELFLSVALAAGETAFRQWSPTVPFAEFLASALLCLQRIGRGLGGGLGQNPLTRVS
ncbi:TetR family transcriptional regulator [Jatrophihabitans sp. DSM 45814]